MTALWWHWMFFGLAIAFDVVTVVACFLWPPGDSRLVYVIPGTALVNAVLVMFGSGVL